MLKKTFNGIWDEYRSLVQQIDTVFHLCRVATPASSVKLPFQYLSPLYGVHIDNVTYFCALKKKALQSFTCVLSYSSWPPGTDLGYPAKASTNWGPHPGLYAAEGEINQVQWCGPSSNQIALQSVTETTLTYLYSVANDLFICIALLTTLLYDFLRNYGSISLLCMCQNWY